MLRVFGLVEGHNTLTVVWAVVNEVLDCSFEVALDCISSVGVGVGVGTGVVAEVVSWTQSQPLEPRFFSVQSKLFRVCFSHQRFSVFWELFVSLTMYRHTPFL